MSVFEEEKIRGILEKELGYKGQQIDEILTDLKVLDPKLTPLLNQWIENRKNIGDFETHGFSISNLMEKFKMNFVAAILSLDWILKEPEKALNLIKKTFWIEQ